MGCESRSLAVQSFSCESAKPHTYYALVESVRTEAGPRQHVVAYLGEPNSAQERHWQRTVVFYNAQAHPLPDAPVGGDARMVEQLVC
jgi:hypothetical protein